MEFVSVYDSLDFESSGPLRKYKKLLKSINKLTDTYRNMDDRTLRAQVDKFLPINLKNKKHVIHIYAIAREVTFRLLGKFQYDVQILGALAALDRNAIQMSTGSGKTITIILPAVAYGLTRKGVNILTVNDYLSERDWKETKPVYDWFGLTNGYTAQKDEKEIQAEAFACDITYSTNSTLGFAYLNSALASDIADDIKIIKRPLHAAIIDEADEILMDDARNPLIIANAKDIGSELDSVTVCGKTYSVQSMVDCLKNLKTIGHDEDQFGQIHLSEETYTEIQNMFGFDDSLFSNTLAMHVINSAITTIFQHRLFEDYVVLSEPDEDTGSRIALIDKATGRLAKGRTLSDNLHSFLEMKEGVFTGVSNTSSLQITYQVLFNLFETFSGVSGTLGTSFSEFKDIYKLGVVVIPDRLPNQLQQYSHVYVTKNHMYDDLIFKTKLYMTSRHPVLIGTASDNEASMVSEVLEYHGIPHKTLISTDNNEDAVVESAGKPGSVVVTTDIMGRGTDIHVEDVDMERGLVVLQVGTRQNSRVERQFAGRAARQGQPGRYHRMLTLPDLKALNMSDYMFDRFVSESIDVRPWLDTYNGDILLDAMNNNYNELVKMIDDTLIWNESAASSNRVDEFRTYSVIDLIQTGVLRDLDKQRLILKDAIESGDCSRVKDEVIRLSLPENKRDKRWFTKQATLVDKLTDDELKQKLYFYTMHICDVLIPEMRDYSNMATSTVRLSTSVKYDVPPETFITSLMQKFLKEKESDFIISLEG